MKRICRKCQQTKDIEYFANAGKIKGVKYWRHYCKKCYYSQKQKRKKSLQDWYIKYKENLECSQCKNDDYRVLDFHHMDSTKKLFNVSEMANAGHSIEKIKKEIEKCIVLCSNCHRIETYNSRNKIIE